MAEIEGQLRDEIDALTRTIARQRASKAQTPAPAPTTPQPAPDATKSPKPTEHAKPEMHAPHPPAELPVTRPDPADPEALARVLVGMGRYAEALDAYKHVDLSELTPDDALAVQYMTALCLRKLDRLADASAICREIADSDTSSPFVKLAKWQLDAINWRQQMETQLKDLRARREAVKAP